MEESFELFGDLLKAVDNEKKLYIIENYLNQDKAGPIDDRFIDLIMFLAAFVGNCSDAFIGLRNAVATSIESYEALRSENMALRFRVEVLDKRLVGLEGALKNQGTRIAVLERFRSAMAETLELHGRVLSYHLEKHKKAGETPDSDLEALDADLKAFLRKIMSAAQGAGKKENGS